MCIRDRASSQVEYCTGIVNPLNHQFPVGLMAQLIEHCTGIVNSFNSQLPVGLVAQPVEHSSGIINALTVPSWPVPR